AMYIGLIHPALEVYLLDRQGRVLQHSLAAPKLPLQQVDLAAVQALVNASLSGDYRSVQLPVYGDDPRVPGQPNLVSIAALPSGAQVQGYLYVVLRGAAASEIRAQNLGQSQFGPAWGLTLTAVALVGLIIVALQMTITGRLRRLAAQMQAFRQPDGAALLDSQGAKDEIDLVAQAAGLLQERVQQQFHLLEEGDRLRRELLSNITHDLHTPIANIQGYVETLLLGGDKLSPELRHQYLQTSMSHCQRLSRRVAELFELARLESGQAPAQLEPFCIADLLSDVVQSQQLSAQQRGVILCLAPDIDRQAQVLADIRLIERVLQNLVENALRHTPAQGRVELALQAQGGSIVVRVKDNGQGIASADLPHIFERYWSKRGNDAAAAVPSAAAGLGLAIVKRILALHGSRIDVSSVLREGTEFSFALPMARA
ncbi:sensor histidine kinase, partial [Roseateles sp.]|uniref:sensor histidine kinase n=1 Tax=Roseateles sp. TaxID=1971397 RepID=UPI00286BD678